MFTDVAGFTGLGERLDPELFRRVMARYFDAMQAAVHRHGGVVEKFIGDAVMAVFGVPRLHEDDALRAVRAAEDMRRALQELNAELESRYQVRLRPGPASTPARCWRPTRRRRALPSWVTPSTWPRASSRRPSRARSCWARRRIDSSAMWSTPTPAHR